MHFQDRGAGGRRPFDPLEPVRRDLLRAAESSELAPLVSAMDAYGVPVASQLEVIRLIGGVKAGSALSGHAMARLMGQSHAEARAHPATAPLRAISEYLGADGPLSDDFKAAYDDMVAAIRRRPRP